MIEPDSPRWRAVSEPRYPHEFFTRDALREILPDRDPVRVWTGFEFEDRDGALHRLDALVITGLGVFALRTLRLAGTIEGDEQSWRIQRADHRIDVVDHPLPALRRAVAALVSSLSGHGFGTEVPVEPLVFLPEDELTLRLPLSGRQHVVTLDADASRFTLEQALAEGRYPGAGQHERMALSEATARAVAQAVDRAFEAGDLRRPDPGRRVGDYRVTALLHEGSTFQDFRGEHALRPGERLRIRRFNQAARASVDAREQVDRAARREHELLQGLKHPGVVPLLGRRASEIGPCLLYPDDPGARRLDHHIAATGSVRPDAVASLRLLIQLADALRYIHGEGIVHRALSPQAVLVRSPEGASEAAIFTWQSGARRSATLGSATTGTHHVQRLQEDQSLVYLAPEVFRGMPVVDEASDVFSLGAVACFALSGRPPAPNVVEQSRVLARDGGFRLGTHVDGLPPALVEAIYQATRPLAAERLDLDALHHAFEMALAALAPSADDVDLLQAAPDATIEGWRIQRTLGRGSTGVALLATSPAGEERVLKVARTPADGGRLRAEHEALRTLNHPQIVRTHGVITLGGRDALVLSRGGTSTLRDDLRKGAVGEELAANLGSDLLGAVGACLERGLLHRDLKPENMGVGLAKREGRERKRLTLFDFSLAGLPPAVVDVGTPVYRDPFLGPDRPWDAAAELYSAGLVLHEIITGAVPVWGDGRNDARFLPADVVTPNLNAERFPAGVRASLLAFFQRALHRDPRQRFADAMVMRDAWRRALQVSATTTPSLAAPSVDTPLVDLGLNSHVLNALERLGVRTAGGLALVPRGRILLLPGVGTTTRQVIEQALARVAPLAEAARAAGVGPELPDPASLPLEAIYQGAQRGYRSSLKLREAYLGLAPIPGAPVWPSAADLVAADVNTSGQVNKLLGEERKRWAILPGLDAVLDEVEAALEEEGGALPPEALAEALRLGRHEGAEAAPYALAVARMAVEVEAMRDAPRFALVRSGDRLVVATDRARVDWAWRLGLAADALAGRPVLPEAAEVLATLRAVDPDITLPADRLLRLAAAFSRTAAVTPRHELYPRGLDAGRALTLARVSVLAAGATWTPEALRARVAERFPEAEPLPDPPALVALVRETGLPLVWRDGAGHFEPEAQLSTRLPATSQTTAGSGPWRAYTPAFAQPDDPLTPDARAFEDWLTAAAEPGAWAIISTGVRTHEAATTALGRRGTLLDVEARLLAHLRTAAGAHRIPFATLLQADARPPGSLARQRLQTLVDAACQALLAELLATEGAPLVLHRVGLLVRYGRVDVLEVLRDAVQQGTATPRAVWVLAPSEVQAGPVLDGHPLPHVTRAQHARLPGRWLKVAATSAA